jgi:hypothetical protein
LSTAVADNTEFSVDFTQNYFAIFVEGRTYTGITTAGVDIDSKTVAGALAGTDPSANLQFQIDAAGGVVPGGGFNAVNALPVINRGLSGGFTAKVKSDGATFTFKGSGELSTPANLQTFQIQNENIGFPGDQTNTIVSGIVETESTPFDVKGIRTSFNSFSPQAAADQATATAATSGGGGSGN